MTFEWALSKLRDGKKVTRESYKSEWCRFVNYFEYHYPAWTKPGMKEHKPGLFGLFSNRLLAEDLEADDWKEHKKEEEPIGAPQEPQ